MSDKTDPAGRYDLILDPLREHTAATPDQEFCRFEGRSYSYKELWDEAQRVAGGLQSLGVNRGDTVGILLENSTDFLAAWFGGVMAGAVIVPIDTAYHGEFLLYVLSHSECSVLLTDRAFMARLMDLETVPVTLRTVVSTSGTLSNSAVSNIAWEELSGPVAPVKMVPADPAAIIYTSGTTGPPKAATLSHRYFLLNSGSHIRSLDLMESDAFYTCTPMFHVLGILLGTMAPLCAGARIVIVRKFSPSTFWDDCREHDVTAFGAVFAMISMLLSRPVSPSDTNHSVRAIFSAGVGATQQEEFENRFGAQLLEGYGLTEGGMLTYMPREHPRHGSCGKPLSESYIVEIHDDADNPVKADEPGEIVARPIVPGTIMSGYWRMPEETVDIFRNLWLHTGDTGRMDSDGYLYFVDRKKDVIRRRGKNISSFSIESALLKHAAVGEVSAYPVPSRLGEDDVMVAVVPVAGSTPTFEELASYAAHVLPAYAVPTYIRFMAELPKTPSSKVRKNVLRKEGITADAWSSPARALAH